MTATDPFVAGPPPDRSRPWRVITDGSLSNGMALGDGRIPPGAPGPGRHVHTHEDEGIYVVTGVLTVEVGEARYEVGTESFVWLPRGVPHVFANLGSEEVRTVGLLSSPGLTGGFTSRPSTLRPFKVPPIPKCSSRSASGTESARLRDHRSFEATGQAPNRWVAEALDARPRLRPTAAFRTHSHAELRALLVASFQP